MDLTIRCPDGRALAARFTAEGAATGPAIDKLVNRFGLLLVTKIKGKASGRPGPNAPTGDYRRSWNVKFRQYYAGSVAMVGTNKPQGPRLEFGFVGADSLGRVYDQPPYPHVTPAMEEIEPQFLGAVDKVLDGILS